MNATDPRITSSRNAAVDERTAVNDRALTTVLLAALATIAAVFAVTNATFFRFYGLAAVQALGCAVILAALIDLRRNRNVHRARWAAVIALGGMLVFLYWYVEGRYASFVWLALFPTVAFSLLGTRLGLAAYTGFVTVIAAVSASYIRAWDVFTEAATVSNMVGAIVVFGVVAYYYESRKEAAYASIADMANTDPLTGVANRRHFVSHAAALQQADAERGTPYCLILIDIDHFKAINDRHGHPLGDDIIRTVLARIDSAKRRGDLLARVGGEEFGVLMADCDRAAGAARAEELRGAVGATPVQVGDITVPVTISIGVACSDGDGEGFAALFAEADARLYRAKRQGRNQVVA